MLLKNLNKLFDQLYLALGLPRWQRICLPIQEMQETQVQFLHWEDPQEEEMETHSSILAWEIPWTEEPGGLQFTGSERVRHSWASMHTHTHTHTHTHIGFCLPVLWFPTLVAQWNHLESFKKSWILAPLFHPPFYLFLSLFFSLYHLFVALCLLSIYLYASFIYLSTYLLSIITRHQTMVMLWTKLETGIKIGVYGGRCYVS